MLHNNEKLTMVSVVYNGRRKVAFVKGFVHPCGKTTVATSVIDGLFRQMCGLDDCRGVTYSVGS